MNNKQNLSSEYCEACNNMTPKLNQEQIRELKKELRGWDVVDNHHLQKKWDFKNFKEPLKLITAISELAEKEGHHPNISFGWGYVEIIIWTHAINGLSRNDFILAAKIDALK